MYRYHLLNVDTVPTTQMIYFYMVTVTLGSSVKKGSLFDINIRGKNIFDSVPSDTEMYLPTDVLSGNGTSVQSARECAKADMTWTYISENIQVGRFLFYIFPTPNLS